MFNIRCLFFPHRRQRLTIILSCRVQQSLIVKLRLENGARKEIWASPLEGWNGDTFALAFRTCISRIRGRGPSSHVCSLAGGLPARNPRIPGRARRGPRMAPRISGVWPFGGRASLTVSSPGTRAVWGMGTKLRRMSFQNDTAAAFVQPWCGVGSSYQRIE